MANSLYEELGELARNCLAPLNPDNPSPDITVGEAHDRAECALTLLRLQRTVAVKERIETISKLER